MLGSWEHGLTGCRVLAKAIAAEGSAACPGAQRGLAGVRSAGRVTHHRWALWAGYWLREVTTAECYPTSVNSADAFT